MKEAIQKLTQALHYFGINFLNGLWRFHVQPSPCFNPLLIGFFFYLSYCSTAVATLRQAVALIFDRVLRAEGLPILHYGGIGGRPASSNSVAGEVSRSMSASEYVVQSELLS